MPREEKDDVTARFSREETTTIGFDVLLWAEEGV